MRPPLQRFSMPLSAFDVDDGLSVAILTGADGTFCAGADLKAVASGRGNRVEPLPGAGADGSHPA